MTDKINIPNVEWIISDFNGCCCGRKEDNKIWIGLPLETHLTDDEILECLADSITHEFIHHVLNHLFPYEVSFLFDAIADHLRLRLDLLRILFKNDTPNTEIWIDCIKKEGFEKGLLDHYFSLDRDIVNKILKEGI